jgi:hypothetical protein
MSRLLLIPHDILFSSLLGLEIGPISELYFSGDSNVRTRSEILTIEFKGVIRS